MKMRIQSALVGNILVTLSGFLRFMLLKVGTLRAREVILHKLIISYFSEWMLTGYLHWVTRMCILRPS